MAPPFVLTLAIILGFVLVAVWIIAWAYRGALATGAVHAAVQAEAHGVAESPGLLRWIQHHFRTFKSALQALTGILVTGWALWEVGSVILAYGLQIDQLRGRERALLDIVGMGLILSTVFEISYMLFTPGPDEAIDPMITGIAAVLVFRLPTDSEPLDPVRVFEFLAYAAIVMLLLWVRRLGFGREQESHLRIPTGLTGQERPDAGPGPPTPGP
ncbi:MAG: hypothetical protein AB7K36_17020 [Chloroflexota bacterium]